MTGTRVLVAVLTYRRPADLAAVLPLLREQAAALDPPARVLVVDNDPDAGARILVEGAGGDVTYAHEPTPGIAVARNRALDEARDADVVVFIDDDERPVGGWLALLLATYHVDRPTGVVGPVVSQYTSELDPWIEAGRFFDRRRLPTGTVVEIAATNNLLLDLAQLRVLDLRFDERFGLSGGSDMLITRQLTAGGGRLVWCDEAVVTDVVPAERLTREWVLRRAYRSGNTTARTSIVIARGTGERVRVRVWLVVAACLRLAGGATRLVVGTVTGSLSQRVRGRRTWARGAGMLAGVTGAVYVEYSRDGRRHVRAGSTPSTP